MSVLAPVARASSSRCGHSTSTGATARNSGPGKSPLEPMADCSSASSVASSARRSVSPVDENGSTSRKSTVPAMVVFRPSIGKRVTVRMPEQPALSFAQLSVLPAPSEVTTPMPVTTTIGLPNLSRGAVMFSPPVKSPSSPNRLDERHPFAAPVTCAYHYNLGRRLGHFNLQPRGIVRRKQAAARDRKRSQAQSQRKLGFHGVAEHGAGRPHREIRMLLQERSFL